MAYIQIKPTDSLFFGGGKPFNAGSDSWTDSSFLPNPSVIWGALFSLLHKEEIAQKGTNFRTTQEQREKLKIKNIYLYNEEQTTILVPAPLDIFVDSEGKRYKGEYRDVDFISNYELPVINMVDGVDVKPLENSFIEINSLYEEYCQDNFDDLVLFNFDEVFVADYKIGIKIDKRTKTAQENHLYRIDLTQFKKEWSFLIEYESDIVFNQSGILKLGGESKIAHYQKIDKPIGIIDYEGYRDEMIEELKEQNEFKILFKTPTYFKDGWQPQQDGLICANIGKSIPIGGFDMETKKPKEMKKYIPAGSVLVFSKELGEISFIDEDSESYKGFGSYELLTKG